MSLVAWHDIECGAYMADLPLWRELAEQSAGAVLDIGAGTGRVSLDLARRGIPVVALDVDDELLAALRDRAGAADVETVVADAREFRIDRAFALIIAPMQTVQLLGGPDGRGAFLAAAAAHLAPGGRLAVALAGPLVPWGEDASALPLPDTDETDGVVRSSQPIRVTEGASGWSIERIRLTSAPDREPEFEHDVITLERVSAAELEAEGRAAGLVPEGRRLIAETDNHVGATVVILARA
jgi:SAM-dependent methyltransferase